MIKRLLLLVIAVSLISPAATSATKSPTPTAKATAKATPAKKPAATKKPVVKKKSKKSLAPSPAPKWPPVGFKSNGEVFAKIPTAKVLIGIASREKALAKALAQKVEGVPVCEKFSCGAIQVASLNGCTWWEVNAKLTGEASEEDSTRITFGLIRTLVKASAPKEIVTVLLISQEPLELRHRVSAISANCHHDAPTEKIPSSIYSAVSN